MRAKVHLERLKKIEDNKAFIEVYVLEGLVKPKQIIPTQELRVQDVLTKSKRLEKFAKGTIVLANGKLFDTEELLETNVVLRSPIGVVDWFDTIVERYRQWQEKRKEGLIELKE